jgi:hypothetical protein
MKPAHYFVEYEDRAKLAAIIAKGLDPDDLEPGERYAERDFPTVDEAIAFARTSVPAWVYERTGLTDVTPVGDPPGLLWDWEERLLEEVLR